LPKPQDLSCTVIEALGDRFDFLAYYSDFRIEHTTEGDVLIQIGIIAELGTAPRNPAGVDDDGSWSETWHRGPETGFEEVGRIGNQKS
jgi:hypothetical protein